MILINKWYTVMVWNETFKMWVWKQPRRFATVSAADAYASRQGYTKYLVADFEDYNQVNREDYIITTNEEEYPSYSDYGG